MKDKIKIINREVHENVTAAKVKLLYQQPFFAHLLLRKEIIELSPEAEKDLFGDNMATAATDGDKIYYSPSFFERLTDEQIMFVLAHEVLHCAYEHLQRRGDRDVRLWNMACDYAINLDLVDSEFTLPDREVIEVCLNEKYRGMNAYQIYDALIQEQENNNNNNNNNDNGDNNGEDGNSQGNNSPHPQPFDKHIEKESNVQKGEHEDVSDALKKELAEAVKAAKQAGGHVPEVIERAVKEWLEPKIDWREVIINSIQSSIKSDFSFGRPNRKSPEGIILPAFQSDDDKINVVVGIDTSGSISEDDIGVFLSEIKGIMEQYTEYNIHVLCWDTQVHNPVVFDEYTADEIEDYVPAGGGGTDLDCLFEYLIENDIQADVLIVFTDGHVNSWGDETYCDNTVFVIYGNDDIVADFGETVHYE